MSVRNMEWQECPAKFDEVVIFPIALTAMMGIALADLWVALARAWLLS